MKYIFYGKWSISSIADEVYLRMDKTILIVTTEIVNTWQWALLTAHNRHRWHLTIQLLWEQGLTICKNLGQRDIFFCWNNKNTYLWRNSSRFVPNGTSTGRTCEKQKRLRYYSLYRKSPIFYPVGIIDNECLRSAVSFWTTKLTV